MVGVEFCKREVDSVKFFCLVLSIEVEVGELGGGGVLGFFDEI